MKKIGVFGGTFNPIHNGHIYLAKSAYKLLNLDKVLVIPSGFSYQKSGENVLSKYIRADMVKLAIKDYPYLEYSDIEVRIYSKSCNKKSTVKMSLDRLGSLSIHRDSSYDNYEPKTIDNVLAELLVYNTNPEYMFTLNDKDDKVIAYVLDF